VVGVRKVLTPRWVAWHVLAVILFVTFLRLGFWQFHRAVQLNSAQSMGYALQWPAFALFGAFFWWRTVRDGMRADGTARPARPERRHEPRRRPVAAVARPVTDDEDPELAAYNRYLAELNERDGR
jgi:DNA-binding transcriptional regulator of glucitol operon